MATPGVTLAAVLLALAGSEWGLADAAGAAGKPEIFVQFSGEGRVSGHGGCNRFGGAFAEEDGGGLRIGPLMATRMACAPEVMEVEARFFAMLEATRRAAATHTRLTLQDAEGNELGALVRRDWD